MSYSFYAGLGSIYGAKAKCPPGLIWRKSSNGHEGCFEKEIPVNTFAKIREKATELTKNQVEQKKTNIQESNPVKIINPEDQIEPKKIQNIETSPTNFIEQSQHTQFQDINQKTGQIKQPTYKTSAVEPLVNKGEEIIKQPHLIDEEPFVEEQEVVIETRQENAQKQENSTMLIGGLLIAVIISGGIIIYSRKGKNQ